MPFGVFLESKPLGILNVSGINTESGVAANVSRPPVDFAAGDPQINSNILISCFASVL